MLRSKLGSFSSCLHLLPDFFLHAHEPEIYLVNADYILVQYVLISTFMNSGFVIPPLQIDDHLVKLVHLGVHDAQVTDKPYFLHFEVAFPYGRRWQLLHGSMSLTKLYGGAM